MSLRHRTLTVVADDGTSPVGADEWNEPHDVTTDFSPTANDNAALGTTSLGWSDLHLALGGVINWGNGIGTIEVGTDFVLKMSTFEKLRIDSAGRVSLGGTAAQTQFTNGNITPSLQVLGIDVHGSSLAAVRYTADNQGGRLIVGKSRSSAVGGYAVLQNDDEIGQITWEASDGTNLAQCASIRAYVDGTPGNNDMPARLLLMTSPDGSQAPQERVRIDNAGITTFNNVIRLTSVVNSSPTDGDLWFDGTDLKFRTGGVTKTVTLV